MPTVPLLPLLRSNIVLSSAEGSALLLFWSLAILLLCVGRTSSEQWFHSWPCQITDLKSVTLTSVLQVHPCCGSAHSRAWASYLSRSVAPCHAAWLPATSSRTCQGLGARYLSPAFGNVLLDPKTRSLAITNCQYCQSVQSDVLIALRR